MAGLSRRDFLVLGAAAGGLGACGFQPVYAPGADGTLGAAAVGLSQIEVAPIFERSGQLLRQALRDRLERAGGGSGKYYDLLVTFSMNSEAISTQRDNTSSRVRMTGVATWALVTQDVARKTVTKGTSRVVDGYNPLDLQYFASDLESDQVQRRISDAVAEQMVLQLALYFNGRKSAG